MKKWREIKDGQNLSTKLVVFLGYNLNKINITIYFKNLTVELHVLYTLNTHVKFYVNWILFTVWFINLYFINNFILQNLQFKQFIKNIVIDL